MSGKKLVRAATSGNLQHVEDALKTQVSQEAKDLALYHAVNTFLGKPEANQYLQIIEMLVKAGSSPTYINDDYNISALINAAAYGNDSILRLLLKAKKIDINQRIFGKTALDNIIYAISNHGLYQEQKDIELIHLFLEAGADPNSALVTANKIQNKSPIVPKIIEVLEHKIKLLEEKATHKGRLNTALGFGSTLPTNIISAIANSAYGKPKTPAANTYNIKTHKPIFKTRDPVRKVNNIIGNKVTQGAINGSTQGGKRKMHKKQQTRKKHKA